MLPPFDLSSFTRSPLPCGFLSLLSVQLWAGQSYPFCESKKAEDIVREMIDESQELLD